MFKRQKLFILGAGASAEVGLPLGSGLAAEIKAKMDIRFENGFQSVGTGDLDLYERLTQNRQKETREYQHAAWLIRDGLGFAQSIDDFLDLHRTNRHANLYGKAAIVKSILQAERKSKLYFDRGSGQQSFRTGKIADTWFVKFMHMLGRGIPKENVREIFEPISFIVFNYDRCVEYFLVHALQNLYGIPDKEAREIIDDLNIIHPYGVVSNDVEFGAEKADYVALAAGIKTYTEQVDNAEIVERLGAEVARANRIIFLGFAYHSQNMAILKPANPVQNPVVYGTAFGMSDSDVDIVSHEIASVMKTDLNRTQRANLIRLENKLKSADLFDYYAKSLTGGD